MGTLYARPDYTAAYLKVAEEYRIPAMAIEPTPKVMEKFKKQGYPVSEKGNQILRDYKLPKLDDFSAAPDGKTYEEKKANFMELVRSFDPGITEIIFHPSVQTECLKAHHRQLAAASLGNANVRRPGNAGVLRARRDPVHELERNDEAVRRTKVRRAERGEVALRASGAEWIVRAWRGSRSQAGRFHPRLVRRERRDFRLGQDVFVPE